MLVPVEPFIFIVLLHSLRSGSCVYYDDVILSVGREDRNILQPIIFVLYLDYLEKIYKYVSLNYLRFMSVEAQECTYHRKNCFPPNLPL